jgi:hypothetical protein
LRSITCSQQARDGTTVFRHGVRGLAAEGHDCATFAAQTTSTLRRIDTKNDAEISANRCGGSPLQAALAFTSAYRANARTSSAPIDPAQSHRPPNSIVQPLIERGR